MTPVTGSSGPGRRGRAPGGALALLLGLLACDDGEIERPRPVTSESPVEYPLALWEAGVEGETRLRIRIDAEGHVDSVAVLESSGRPRLDSAAVRGARQLRFEPARDGEDPVAVWAELPVRFSRTQPPPDGTP